MRDGLSAEPLEGQERKGPLRFHLGLEARRGRDVEPPVVEIERVDGDLPDLPEESEELRIVKPSGQTIDFEATKDGDA